MNIKIILISSLILALILVMKCSLVAAESSWPTEKANAWYRSQGWLVGCNFIPSTAINQVEMWQADTFDPTTIDRELGWAEQLGFTSVRVFLHDLLWQQDSKGFLQRLATFLSLADKHHIRVVFVLFDSCWNPFPKLGPQPSPKPHLHNSGWVQCPGYEFMEHPERFDELQPYVQGVIGYFRNDSRVVFWDLFNEPDNLNSSSYFKQEPANKRDSALLLLRKTFAWARQAKPTQPLTSGVWMGNWADPARLTPTERVQLEESDIITFHNYSKLEKVKECVQNLRRYQRPILCTEYMARPMGSTFDPILRYFKNQNVGAYNWGFVVGKTQTIYPWDSWNRTYTAEPPVWFHDIFRADGSPYDAKEIGFIKSVTAQGASAIRVSSVSLPAKAGLAQPMAQISVPTVPTVESRK